MEREREREKDPSSKIKVGITIRDDHVRLGNGTCRLRRVCA